MLIKKLVGKVAAVVVAVSSIGLVSFSVAAADDASRQVLIENVNIFDGKSNKLQPKMNVLVEGETIKVYADAGKPELVEGFTKNTFTAMVEGVRQQALDAGMIPLVVQLYKPAMRFRLNHID